jgi:serine/threonine protein kinase
MSASHLGWALESGSTLPHVHDTTQQQQQQQQAALCQGCAACPSCCCRYHDCFADGHTLNIVMEYADSGDLHRLLQQHAKAGNHLPEDQLLRYFVQLVAALAYIHSRGLMHRDLKANNIFMTSQGLLKLGDFGLVKVSWLSQHDDVMMCHFSCDSAI